MGYVDFHVHPFLWISEEEIRGEMERAGVEKAVLIAIDIDPGFFKSGKAKKLLKKKLIELGMCPSSPGLGYEGVEEKLSQSYSIFRINNERVAGFGEGFYAFGSVNVSRGKGYIREKLKEIEELGIKGVKVLPTLQLFSPLDDNFLYLLRELDKRNIALMYHTSCDPEIFEYRPFCELGNPEKLGKALRYVHFSSPLILAHFGSYSALSPKIYLREAEKLLKEYSNLYADTSAVNNLFRDGEFIEVVGEYVDKILFGSDYPAVRGAGIKENVELVLSSGLSSIEKEKILKKNAERLLREIY